MGNTELQQLLSIRQESLDLEIPDSIWQTMSKLNLRVGSAIDIYWESLGDNFPDRAFIFTLPLDNLEDELDFFVCIPEPQNPSGIGTPPPVYLHFYDLMTNPDLEEITLWE